MPKDIPWIITEYGYSSFAGQAEVELPAALLNAEIVLQWFMTGVKAAYLYGIEPNEPDPRRGKVRNLGQSHDASGESGWRGRLEIADLLRRATADEGVLRSC